MGQQRPGRTAAARKRQQEVLRPPLDRDDARPFEAALEIGGQRHAQPPLADDDRRDAPPVDVGRDPASGRLDFRKFRHRLPSLGASSTGRARAPGKGFASPRRSAWTMRPSGSPEVHGPPLRKRMTSVGIDDGWPRWTFAAPVAAP
jgi:hypothetical protein